MDMRIPLLGIKILLESNSSQVRDSSRRGRWAEALWCLGLARRQGVALDAPIYKTAVDAVARQGEVHGAGALLGAMRDQTIEPSALDFEGLLVASRAARSWEDAVQCMDVMRQGAMKTGAKAQQRAVGVCWEVPNQKYNNNTTT